jgi:hypothetical protein
VSLKRSCLTQSKSSSALVVISDLATAPDRLLKLHDWIRSEVIESGHGTLDDGHWLTATERQRAAAIEHPVPGGSNKPNCNRQHSPH